jgi:protein-S-isoprenylcysteine O-methyltransferase Ste14
MQKPQGPPKSQSVTSTQRPPTAKSARPAVVDVALLAAGMLATAYVTFVAWRDGAGKTPDIASAAVVGLVLGGLVNTLLVTVFRAGEMSRLENPYYTTPNWRPTLVAGLIAAVGLACALLCAYWIGQSWSRN